MANPASPRWYAIHVRRRFESFVALRLQDLVEECYVPLRRVGQPPLIDVPLFPGYVFSKCTSAVRHSLFTIPGVLGPPAGESSIPEQEILNIRRIVTSGLPVVAIPLLCFKAEGRVVAVETGPLRDLTGILTHTEKPFLVISFEAIDQFIAVEINRPFFKFADVQKAAAIIA